MTIHGVERETRKENYDSLGPALKQRLSKAARPETRGTVFERVVLEFALNINPVFDEVSQRSSTMLKIQETLSKYIEQGLPYNTINSAFNVAVNTCSRFHREQEPKPL